MLLVRWWRRCDGLDVDVVEEGDAASDLNLYSRGKRRQFVVAGANSVKIVPVSVARMLRDGKLLPSGSALQTDACSRLRSFRPAPGGVIVTVLEQERSLADPRLTVNGVNLERHVPHVNVARAD